MGVELNLKNGKEKEKKKRVHMAKGSSILVPKDSEYNKQNIASFYH